MIRYLLDTNVVSQAGKPKPDANVIAWLDTVDDLELAISVVTLRELTYGVEKARAAGHPATVALESGVAAVGAAYAGRILPIDSAAATAWAVLLAEQNSHTDDKAQVAIAKVHGLTLVSRNVRDVVGRGVDVLDPFKSPARLYPAD